jgi:hypothetical protein
MNAGDSCFSAVLQLAHYILCRAGFAVAMMVAGAREELVHSNLAMSYVSMHAGTPFFASTLAGCVRQDQMLF